VPIGTFTIDHPWGTTTFTSGPGNKTCTGNLGARCDFTRDIPVGILDFDAALGAGFADSMSTFLQQTAPPPPVGFLGDGLTESPVVGGPGTVRNVVTITPPGGLPSTISS
jgi:hypothetical protein